MMGGISRMKTLSRSTAIVLVLALGLSGVAGNLLMPANG